MANHAVANAVGAAIAQVSGEVDQIFTNLGREELLEQARKIAVGRAVAAGADADTVTVIEQEDIPLAYLPGNASGRGCGWWVRSPAAPAEQGKASASDDCSAGAVAGQPSVFRPAARAPPVFNSPCRF